MLWCACRDALLRGVQACEFGGLQEHPGAVLSQKVKMDILGDEDRINGRALLGGGIQGIVTNPLGEGDVRMEGEARWAMQRTLLAAHAPVELVALLSPGGKLYHTL